MLRWFCAEVKPGCADLANEHLLRQDFNICHPTFLTRRVTRGLLHDVERPLFPGYVLVQFDRMIEGWQCINGTRGIKRLMCGASELPLPVPVRVMDDLLGRMKAGPMMDAAWLARFTPGQRLRVKDGPLAGQRGTCMATDHHRIWVLLGLLGSRPIEINDDSLEAA